MSALFIKSRSESSYADDNDGDGKEFLSQAKSVFSNFIHQEVINTTLGLRVYFGLIKEKQEV